jgi:polysaccharide pyruvyl transferase WcaK-like protein
MGLEYVNVNKKTKLTSSFLWNRRSVEQWIKAIAESSFVITHSFHGVAMCLVHHRPFVAIYEKGGRISRLASLLEIADLQNRLFSSIEDAAVSNVWNEEINWNKVDELLKVEREKSMEYLNAIIK